MPPGLFASAIAILVLHDSAAKVGEATGEVRAAEAGEELGTMDGLAPAVVDWSALAPAAGDCAPETDGLPHPDSISNTAIAIAFIASTTFPTNVGYCQGSRIAARAVTIGR